MLDRVVQGRLGLRLKQIYAEMPKAEMPARIWALLVALEREAAQAEKLPRV